MMLRCDDRGNIVFVWVGGRWVLSLFSVDSQSFSLVSYYHHEQKTFNVFLSVPSEPQQPWSLVSHTI